MVDKTFEKLRELLQWVHPTVKWDDKAVYEFAFGFASHHAIEHLEREMAKGWEDEEVSPTPRLTTGGD